jgi:hypothetical protein
VAIHLKGCPRTSASFYSMARSYPQRTVHNNGNHNTWEIVSIL